MDYNRLYSCPEFLLFEKQRNLKIWNLERYVKHECAGFGAQKFGARNFEPTIWCLRFSAQKRDLVPGRFSAWEILCLKYDLVPGRFGAQRFGDREI